MKITEIPVKYHVELTDEEYDLIECALMFYSSSYNGTSDFDVKLGDFVAVWIDRGGAGAENG